MNMKNTFKAFIMALAIAALTIAGPLAAMAEDQPAAEEPAMQAEPAAQAEPATQAEPAADANAAEPGDIELDEELEALLSGTTEKKVYKFPEVRPEYSLEFGYAYAGLRNSPTSGRYMYHKQSPIIGLDIKNFSFPSRLHLEVDGINERDYFGDLRYAYGDTIQFRWISVGLYKNPERFLPLTTDNGYTVNDRDETYGYMMSFNRGTLRFKTPDFPAHAYFKYWRVEKDGWVQEQHLGGSGYYDNLEIVTDKRRVNWSAEEYHMGGNMHIGYVELQASHSNTTFEPNTDNQIVHSDYTTSSFRSAGSWPHNMVSEFSGVKDTLQMHTTYTGKLVMSATVSRKKYENNSSGAKSNYIIGASSLTWMPVTSTTFFAKYKHTRIDNDTPSQSTISNFTNSASYTYNVKPAINSSANDASLVGRFRLASWAVLRTRLMYEQILRDNAEEWGLENGETKTRSGMLSLNLKPSSRLSLHGDYLYSNMDGQAYNTDYDSAHKVQLGADWNPADWLTMSLCYTARGEDRDNLLYSSMEGAKDRSIYRDNAMLSVGMVTSEHTYLTATANQLLNTNRQDIVYYDASNVATVSPGVLYEDVATSYSLDLSYIPNERVSLGTGVTHTRAEGRLNTTNPSLLLPVSIEDMTDMDYTETTATAYGDFKMTSTFSMKVEYEYTQLDDKIESSYDSIEDGESHLAKVTFRKKW